MFWILRIIQGFQESFVTGDPAAVFRRACTVALQALCGSPVPGCDLCAIEYLFDGHDMLPRVVKVIQIGKRVLRFEMELIEGARCFISKAQLSVHVRLRFAILGTADREGVLV